MLDSICRFLDEFLCIREIEDYPNALNGLQLENDGVVTRIGAAVDASESIIEMAVLSKVDLLIVHHGLFWSGLARITGLHYRKLKEAFSSNLAIYSAHLPLDMHREVGNNVLLARALDLGEPEPFLLHKGHTLGYALSASVDRGELVARLKRVLGRELWICPSGPEQISRVGIVTGDAGSELAKANAQGVDTFVTGEGPHYTFSMAEELRMNLIYGGHYATETFGVRALAERLALKFNLPWIFLDHPSGL
ncbi:MAG TPA: Nif3-like dinuclear metal center hexameric protein [Chthoniobacterales bacterium]|jgi:dinuclear metal center YbgI/SA1388 family protein|nr:Nif3-like dinuclear metal center hexameric protein [Chthoniobacterales bacterium]